MKKTFTPKTDRRLSSTEYEKRKKLFEERLYNKFKNKIKIKGVYVTTYTPIELYCREHKVNFTATPKSIVFRVHGCPQCGVERKSRKLKCTYRRQVYKKAKLAVKNNFGGRIRIRTKLEEFIDAGNTVRVSCAVCKSTWRIAPKRLSYGMKYGCKTCSIKETSNKTKIPIANIIQAIKIIHNNTIVINKLEGRLGEMECRKCNSVWKGDIARYAISVGCRKCNLMKSGWVGGKKKEMKLNGIYVTVQGYEPQAIRWILKNTNIEQHEINMKPKVFKYFDSVRKVERDYVPDFSIDSKNIIVEVKSILTIGAKKNTVFSFDNIKDKAKAVIQEGYRFNLMLMGGDGCRIKLPKDWITLSCIGLRKYLKQQGIKCG
jgi:hypothetical protein